MKTIVTFSGAGLSQESGIPTFRDSNGLWHNHKVEEIANHDAWPRNKDLMLEFYKQRLLNVNSVEPNAGHKALASLESKYKVINITQNIDNLLERAGCSSVWHLHGSIYSRKCEFHKDIGDSKYQCDYRKPQTEPVKDGDICPKCGGHMRPDVVWFGEAVDLKAEYLVELAKECFAFIGIGTSAQVYPAANLINIFKNSQKKYFVDPNPPLRLQSFTRLAGTACEHLPVVAKELLEI